MKKFFKIFVVEISTISILFFLLLLGTAYSQEKQKACLAPMGALGEFSEMEKQIIFNSLQESLSTHYILSSQKAFEAAQNQAFDELEYDECTEEQCFALIQQLLQVDNLFLFNMTREGNFTQFSLTRVDLDSQRLVRTSFCENCNIKQLNNNVDQLVLKIFEEDKISIAGTKIKQESTPEEEPKQEPIPEEEPTEEPVTKSEPEKSPSSDKTWHYVAISMTLVSALMSYNVANSYNDLSDKNKALATQYANSSSSSEKASYKSEYDSNASEMKSYKSAMQTWDMLTLVGLGWGAYLYFSDDSEVTALNDRNSSLPFVPRLAFKTHSSQTQTVLFWNWRF